MMCVTITDVCPYGSHLLTFRFFRSVPLSAFQVSECASPLINTFRVVHFALSMSLMGSLSLSPKHLGIPLTGSTVAQDVLRSHLVGIRPDCC